MSQQKYKKKYKQSLLQKLRIRIAFCLLGKGVKDMAVIYATLIINGHRTFAQVPAVIKPQVRQVLIDLEVPELAE